MIRIEQQHKMPSIYTIVLLFSGLILTLYLTLFASFTLTFICKRNQTNIETTLMRSMAVAWKIYNDFFDKTLAVLSPLNSFNTYNQTEEATIQLAKILCAKQQDIDFWLIVNNSQKIIAASYNNSKIADKFIDIIKSSQEKKEPIFTSEVVSIKELNGLDPSLAKRAAIQIKDPANQNAIFSQVLLQIIAMPLYNKNFLWGTLIAGHLLNNDQVLAEQYSNLIPDSFLGLSIGGVRIANNIKSPMQSNFVGTIQEKNVIKAIEQGKRYVGRTTLEPKDIHLVVSDPIYDFEGKIIGDITVGVPSRGLANLTLDTFAIILVSALICLILVLFIASFVVKKFTLPLVALDRVVKKICEAKTITARHINYLNHITKNTSLGIREIVDLRDRFSQMAVSLYQKSQENKNYLEKIKKDRQELQQLSIELHKANVALEKKVEEQTKELRQLVVKLKELNNLKSQFLANISHELRTPLNSIIGFSEMLYDELYGKLNHVQKEYVEIVLTSARHLLEIITDILDLSRIEQGKIIIYKQEVNIPELILSVETIIRPQADSKNLTLETHLPKELPKIYVDPTRIKQVLYNLLSNAVKFTPFKGTITISVDYNDHELAIKVKDTGIGIKPEDLKHVFEEFYQAESPYEKKFEGVGLGLPLCKRLIELHNGRIDIQSQIGKGTTVTVYLPISI
ncbi:signal transduction histidine kinase [Moorella thermoacetica Y72]|uniref:histidine kinase n=1 Tax=Moorella thermoacetica Y72 TaxID=1325331 RepID=A0A0S6UGE7_NEOTH|nr:ATP-binding protein [Moorella thermoacetica]GAF26075.1 signal transduction histidine kinase [Moorella thermoacetica Y72]